MSSAAPESASGARPAWLFDLPAGSFAYRDDAVLVVDKPAGVPCQSPDASQPDDLPRLLIRRLARERGVPEAEVYLGTHQRLDQDTSGVLLYSLAPGVNAALAQQFRDRTVEKHYLAAVSGKPPRPGSVLEHWLAPGPAGTMQVVPPGRADAKLARTRVLEVETRADRSLIRLAIDTGRTHQVRVQLAAIGCPIAGDVSYGGEPALRVLLHSERLAFVHPTSGERVEVVVPAPYELSSWLARDTSGVYADPAALERVLLLAAARRVGLMRAYEAGETTAFRWVHGAADGLDDVYVDVYDRWLVLRVDGDERTQDERALIAMLERLGAARGEVGFIGGYAKHHPRQANELVDPSHEQFAPRLPVFGAPAPESFVVYERGVPLEVRLNDGLRTGLFLDQRDNRALVSRLAAGKRVLNLFGYTGSFSVVALAAGASAVRTVDTSRAALAWAERNVARVGAIERHRSVAEDAFVALRAASSRRERFDCVVLDPPSYSTSKHGRFRVRKDYAALCSAALQVLEPGGVLIACLNHHGISRAMLRRFVEVAARTSGCTLESLRDLPAQRDFPVSAMGEPAMKSVIARVAPDRGMRSASAGMKPRPASRPKRGTSGR